MRFPADVGVDSGPFGVHLGGPLGILYALLVVVGPSQGDFGRSWNAHTISSVSRVAKVRSKIGPTRQYRSQPEWGPSLRSGQRREAMSTPGEGFCEPN